MSSFRAKPLRRIRHELFALGLVSVVPVAIGFAFPREALTFRSRGRAEHVRPTCAFVTLTADEERAALTAARTSWQVDARGARHMRVDIMSGELPPAPMKPVVPTRPTHHAAFAVPEYVPNLLPPTVAAPRAAVIKPDAEDPSFARMPFPRKELLKID